LIKCEFCITKEYDKNVGMVLFTFLYMGSSLLY